MIYWDLQVMEGVSGVYLMDEEATKNSVVNGIHPPTIRQALINGLESVPRLKILNKNGEDVISEPELLGDIFMWGSVRVFSEKAKAVLINMGGKPGDFLKCNFGLKRQGELYMLLPEKILDVVDVERSGFLNRIPVEGKNPILLHMRNFVPKESFFNSMDFPPYFLSKMPGYLQSFSELFVSNGFREEWEGKGLGGAYFRSLSE